MFSKPLADDEIFITGMSGRLPNCHNLEEFIANLMNKRDMVKPNPRWQLPEETNRNGIMPDAEEFDYDFFHKTPKMASCMLPAFKSTLEVAYEAILDAGCNPEELRGSRTGVFTGTCFLEVFNFFKKSEDALRDSQAGLSLMAGNIASQLSHFFEFDGPSLNFDSACSTSLYQIEAGYKAIRDGKCENALVLANSFLMDPEFTKQFFLLGVLSPDGACKSFDNGANGYVRSEAVVAIFLQKAKIAKRNYGEVIFCQTSCDGYKEMGITFPSADDQFALIEDFYKNVGVSYEDVGYFEAHATGTPVGDPQELKAIYNSFCVNRTKPLLIGSVKASIGHAEATSGLASVIKCLVIFLNGIIPPNIHVDTLREGIQGLQDGKLQVVTEATPLPGDYVAISNFGFGGGNGHLLLKRPQSANSSITAKIPSRKQEQNKQLLCLSGRNVDAVNYMMQQMSKTSIDAQFLHLLHLIYRTTIPMHNGRLYAIIEDQSVTSYTSTKVHQHERALHCVFDSNFCLLDLEGLQLTGWAAHKQEVCTILTKHKITLDTKNIFGSPHILNTICQQTYMVKLFAILHLNFTKFIGIGIGELSAAYADNLLTLEQVVMSGVEIINYLKHNDGLDAIKLAQSLSPYCKINKLPKKLLYAGSLENVPNLCGHIAEKLQRMTNFDNIFNKSNNYLLLGKQQLEVDMGNVVGFTKDASLLDVLGRLYLLGYDLTLEELYPQPALDGLVPSGVRLISPLIKWLHRKSWSEYTLNNKNFVYLTFGIKLDESWGYVEGHNIDGRVLFPATGYLYLVWKTLHGMLYDDIMFEDIKFMRACTVSDQQELRLNVQINKISHEFEIADGTTVIVTGRVFTGPDLDMGKEWLPLDKLPPPKEDQLMTKKDIYKELGLRGYYYQNQFKELQDLALDSTIGHIKWTQWIPFLDDVLQTKVLEIDTRSLYVPVKLSKVIINAKGHYAHLKASQDPKNCVFPVYNYKDLNMVRTDFVEMRGLHASTIAKRKHATPVLESNCFVPYFGALKVEEAARVFVQLALENCYSVKVKILEEFTHVSQGQEECLIQHFQKALNDLPIIQPEMILVTQQNIDLSGVTLSQKDLKFESNCYMALGSNLSTNCQLREKLVQVLKPEGFLISREDTPEVNINGFDILAQYEILPGKKEHLVLLKPASQKAASGKPEIVHVQEESFRWLETIKQAKTDKKDLLLYAVNESHNGLLGLTNCLLKETGSELVTCILVDDVKIPKFDPELLLFKDQLGKNLAVNVFKNGAWGSYRHLVLDNKEQIETTHSYVNNTVRGDLSSLCWLQGDLSIPENRENVKNGEEIVHVYVASLNFRDVMCASGKITLDSICKERKFHECILGNEFSGRRLNGERVMGLMPAGAMSNMVKALSNFLWKVPDNWNLLEAATVPAIYCTNIYGLLMRGRLQEGDSILIHSATGGIGLSALHIATHFKCQIFVTVGTPEKKRFIQTAFPSIDPSHIGNSRDTSFYEMILRETKGLGVDLILNSLADEKLHASVKCLKTRGRFVEIGKFDLNADNSLQIDLANLEAEYHGVMLDVLMGDFSKQVVIDITRKLQDGIRLGYVKPIAKTVFNRHDLEESFRYMSTGRHIGKIVLSIRQEETHRNAHCQELVTMARPKFYCNPNGVYIISGGLGGFGLELADWLAIRGAKNIILVSRRGITNGYQKFRIKTWKNYNCNVHISTDDLAKQDGCLTMLKTAQSMGEIRGIFNLAVVLRDAVLENQTITTFQESYNPKAQATLNLDTLSRRLAPKLEHFVVFSSVSCGRGNAGQTNYGYSNSVMERVCEKRCQEGLPGKAIQWGVIGDVGIVADYKEQNVEIVIGGTMHQRIANCLEVMDLFMTNPHPIVSSMIVAEKESNKEEGSVDVIANIMQIKDVKAVSQHATFPELGMDSMMAVVLKQTLERDFDVFLSPQELRGMTFHKLNELINGPVGDTPIKANEESEVKSTKSTSIRSYMEYFPKQELLDVSVVDMFPGNPENILYLVPGAEGASTSFDSFVSHLKHPAKCLQFTYENIKDGIIDMAAILSKQLKLKPKGTFNIACHSLGSSIGIEMVSLLEAKGHSGNLILLDGTPALNKANITAILDASSEATLQVSIILTLMSSLLTLTEIKSKEQLLQTKKTLQERVDLFWDACNQKLPVKNKQYYFKMISNIYRRNLAEVKYKPALRKAKSNVFLFSASTTSAKLNSLSQNYGIGQVFSNKCNFKEFQGDHVSFLENEELINDIRQIITV